MIPFEEWVAGDASAWAERVRRKEVDALELVDAAIARAEATEPKVNAIAAKLYERARERARQRPEGVLGGVPWVVKDLYQTSAGTPLTNGSRSFAGHVGAEDAELVRRWNAAGLIPICTSTTPEFAISATTESSLYGPTRNPWNLARTSGGSSGGSSALVAAGVVPAAHATDGGGSIRGPASCCGLFGLKPSRGRVPIAPGRTEGWLGCSATHAVTRSVRDSALLLDATQGPEPGSRYVAPPPSGRFVDALERPPAPLRIAVHWETAPGIVPDPACVAAVESAASLCRELGHEVVPAAPPVDHAELGVAFARVVITASAAVARGRARARGLESVAEELEPVTRAFVALADQIPALDLVAANEAFMRAALVVDRFMADFDMILSPTLGRPPVPLGTVSLLQPLAEFSAATAAFSCFTALQNQTGQPAMSVPLHWSDDGLPIGVHFAARVGEEELLFAVARQLEEARPWFHRMPPL